jgi:hypothetical protein
MSIRRRLVLFGPLSPRLAELRTLPFGRPQCITCPSGNKRAFLLGDCCVDVQHERVNVGTNLGDDTDMCTSHGNPPLLQTFRQNFESVALLGLPSFMRAFILSMSTAADELSQWRAYANNAIGYRLAFNTTVLDQAFAPFSSQAGGAGGSFMVQYKASDLRHQMDILTGQVASSIVTMPMGPVQHVNWALSRISSYLMLNIILIGLHFKHPAYHSEAEFRYLITTPANARPPGLQTRARNHDFVDYLVLDWKNAFPNALVDIMSGPAVDIGRATRFMTETLFHMPSGSTVATNHSNIPYRT